MMAESGRGPQLAINHVMRPTTTRAPGWSVAALQLPLILDIP